MGSGTRSRNGCWTCRLRRKKCDERRPFCSICEALGITCAAYGPRPEWMDGGEKEKEAAINTRHEIKIASRRIVRDTSRDSSGPTVTTPREASLLSGQTPGPRANSIEHHPENHPPSVIIPAPPKPPPATIVLGNATEYILPRTIKEREACLLMFYLDYVFPRQFKMHSPSIADGGRGWLLSLFLRTPPLYHVTLALSAHCLDNLNHPDGGDEYKTISLEELDLALQHMQQYIHDFINREDSLSLEENIKVCGCILQMIAFECFKGGTDQWRLHLDAASKIIPVIIEVLLSQPTSKVSPYVTSTPPATELESVSATDGAAMEFIAGVFIWFEIIGSITTGARPCLESYHEALLGGVRPVVDIQKIMGIEAWVIILIGKIASLDHWKRDSQRSRGLSMMSLASKAAEIERDLESGLARLCHSPTSGDSAKTCNGRPDSISLANLAPHSRYVSQIYILAALIYLHVVVSGPVPEVPEVRSNVLRACESLQALPDPQLVRSLYWPILVTGSMAMPHEEPFFRDLISTSGITRSTPGIGWHVLTILEQCWSSRGAGPPRGDQGYWMTMMSHVNLELLVY
ncbi:hypothetical protein BP5796_04409 [Coleophoma crateriformis]|uniref:Zn(2)-C6 fungal-type domain-containing protein n=1 Tax=Coleophoma crateriformis TaxID=565419 RepID=A0A3D8SAW8_9HELO|nr:hypothetical protein BP5796_04409 [Coleophoma crateriformis]